MRRVYSKSPKVLGASFKACQVYDLKHLPLMLLGAKPSTCTFGSPKTLHGSFSRRKQSMGLPNSTVSGRASNM